MVQTDSTNFRSVVQELTGNKRKSLCDSPESESHSKDQHSCLGSNDECNLALIACSDDIRVGRSNKASLCKLSPQSVKEVSTRKSYTGGTSYSDDSQQEEVTSILVDEDGSYSADGSSMKKKSKLGESTTSSSSNNSNCTSSSSKQEEDLRAPAILHNMDMLVSEMFSHEAELIQFVPTPPASPPVSSTITAFPDIFADLYDNLDDFFKLEFFLLS